MSGCNSRVLFWAIKVSWQLALHSQSPDFKITEVFKVAVWTYMQISMLADGSIHHESKQNIFQNNHLLYTRNYQQRKNHWLLPNLLLFFEWHHDVTQVLIGKRQLNMPVNFKETFCCESYSIRLNSIELDWHLYLKLYTEFDLAAWLRMVRFTVSNISKFWFFLYTCTMKLSLKEM